MATPNGSTKRFRKGFQKTGALLNTRIRKAGESRGFAVSRLLTRWAEVAGPDLAPMCQPLKVGYGRSGIGATLTVFAKGAHAPLVEMQKEALRTRVNACYGYNAISRILITQTAPGVGLAEAQVGYDAKPKPAPIAPETIEQAAQAAAPVKDDSLRAALEALGQNVLSRKKRLKGAKS